MTVCNVTQSVRTRRRLKWLGGRLNVLHGRSVGAVSTRRDEVVIDLSRQQFGGI